MSSGSGGAQSSDVAPAANTSVQAALLLSPPLSTTTTTRSATDPEPPPPLVPLPVSSPAGEDAGSEQQLLPSALFQRFMDITSLHPVLKSFLVGSASGCCSTLLFQPLDLLKTRLQSPTTIGHGGMFTVLGQIVRTENFFALWKGMLPSLTRCVPGVGLYFASIHGLKLAFQLDEQPKPLEAILLGATARSFSGVAMIPFTVIKCRFESRVYEYGSIREALRLIYRAEGLRGLSCGLLPTLLRDAPFSGLYLMIYSWTKQTLPQDWMDSSSAGPYVRFSAGLLAGFGASLLTQPADVIKTKMQLFPTQFQSIPPAVAYVYQRYGLRGYFKGLMPRMVRRTLVAAMSWTVYEHVIQNVGLK